MCRNVSELIGKTLKKINADEHEVTFITQDNEEYLMYHEQDCCESVWLEDVTGDLEDLIGSPITMAEEITQDGSDDEDCFDDSRTWTFYKFATNKGYVTLRWCGESNGYYSESVDFKKVN